MRLNNKIGNEPSNTLIHHRHSISSILLLFITLCAYASVLVANEQTNSPQKKTPELELKLPQDSQRTPPAKPSIIDIDPLFSLLDQPQQYISTGISDFTKRIDEFFSDEKIQYESNGSFLRLTGDMVLSKTEQPGFAGDLKGKIELPNTRRRLKLVFESDPAEAREELERTLDNNPLEAAQDKSYFAGIEGLWGEFKYWKFRPSVGLKINSTLDTFIRFRANRRYQISEKWLGYLKNTLYWFDSSGYGFDSSLELDRKLSEQLLFRSSFFAGWKQENRYWELNQVFSASQTIDTKQAIIYQAGVYGISEPQVFATDYLLQVRYRKKLHADYLFLELIPKIQYPREEGFSPFYSFTVRLEMVFTG